MKRFSVLFLILTLILSSFSVVSAASGTEQVVAGFNVMPMTCSADSDNLVTRRDFAYTISNILGCGELDPRDTEYVDVNADMEDSGYIYYALVNGFLVPTGNMFCPDDPISFHDFNAAVVKLLAYETIANANGGGVDGNLKTVMDLHLYNGVTAKNYDTVTATQYRKLIYNLLTADITDFSYSYDESGNVNLYRTGAKKTILSLYFGISRYYGSITEVNHAKPSVKFTVTKNVSEVNPTMLTVGGNYSFLSNGKVDLNFYKNIPVEIWTDKDGVIVYIAPQPNVRVFFDVIYSINGDVNPNNPPYGTSLIRKMKFNGEDKAYQVDPLCTVKYNGVVQDDPILKPKQYAKITMIDNKVTAIETWQLEEGGMVNEINNSYISYTKGEVEGRLKNIGFYENITVVVEGRSTDRNQIKPGSLFHYYQTDDTLVIVVSEKTIVGDFESIGSGELEIGRNFYSTNGDIYCSEDGVNFFPNDFTRLFGTQVICYLDIYGNIRYMRAGNYLQDENVFTAYVIGHSSKAFEDTKIKVQKLYPELEEAIITLPADFTNYVDNPATGTTADPYGVAELQTNLCNPLTWDDRTTAYKKIYKFTVNKEGEITEIAEPDYFLLFGEAHTAEQVQADGTLTPVAIPAVPMINAHLVDFPNDGGTRAYLCLSGTSPLYDGLGSSSGNAYYYYNHGEHFVVLCNDNGKMVPVETNFSEMRSKGAYDNVTDMRIAMLAEPGASTPYVWIIYGNTDKIYQHQGGADADVDSITQKYDVETDTAYYEVVLDNGNLTWKLDSITFADHPEWTVASSEEGTRVTETELEPGMRVGYREGAIFNDNEVYITDVTVYPKLPAGTTMTMEDWAKKNADEYLVGKVKKITDHRLFLENGGAYHLANGCGIIGIKLDGDQVKQIELSEADVPSGATIYYNRTFSISTIYVQYTD